MNPQHNKWEKRQIDHPLYAQIVPVITTRN